MLVGPLPTEEETRPIVNRAMSSAQLTPIYISKARAWPRPEKMRELLASYSLLLTIEIHESMWNLASRGYYASQHALFRSLLEVTTRAYWFIYAAKPDVFKNFTIGRSTPDLEHMLIDLRKSGLVEGVAQIESALAQIKKSIHSFAHGSIAQLQSGRHGFDVNDILLTFRISDHFLFYAMHLSAKIFDDKELFEFNTGLLRNLTDEAIKINPEAGLTHTPLQWLPNFPKWPETFE